MAAPLHNVPYTPRAPSSAGHGTPVTKSDSTVYNPPLTALWVAGTGDIAVLLAGDDTPVTLTDVPVGMLFGFAISKVMSANTDATGIVGFW